MINPLDFIKMKQKILLYIILFAGLSQSAWAQDDLKRANDFFEKAYYADAIALYEEALPRNKSSQLIKNLADCYYHTFDMKSAARWYGYLVSNYGENIGEDYYFKLNQSLKAIGKYDEAKNILQEYYTKKDDKEKLQKLKEASVYLENVRAIGERFSVENLELNTTTSEFGAMQIGSQIWYTATHKASTSKKYRWNNQNYLDIYSHPKDKLMLGDSISQELSENINTKLHEGAFSISLDKKTIYFTRNNFFKGKRKTDDNKVSNLKIYSATRIDGVWKNITELPFNSDNFSNEHPAINTDGTKLYFASDRPGGYGSFDIYEVNIQSNGSFSTPINLGKTINTDKKEQFPFIDTNNTLYFSSNGYTGFGLLDIFISKNKNGSFQKADNLGLPINSGYDDFSYILNKDGNTGYFASNRPKGKGSDDIYSFTETKELNIEDCKQYISGVITDLTTKLILADVEIIILDSNNNTIDTFKAIKDGTFKFEVNCEAIYTIKAQKAGYESNSKTVLTDKERNAVKDASMTLYSDVEKEKAAQLAIEQRLETERKKEEKAKVKATLLVKQKLKVEKEAAEQLAQRKKEEKAITEKAKTKKIANVIQKESAIIKEKDRTVIKTEEIHFDYSLWYLRRESRERLGTVIKVMKENPGMVIEIGTHTDIRGNKNYNEDLSQKRADSAKEYLIKNGIVADRIISKGYGESQPIVKCATEADCTEEDHEWNRRCEFVIVSWDYEPNDESKN